MLDEFPALGKLQFFQESLAYLAGYGIRAMLITQDLSQHQGVYGRQESITANCHVRIAFAANKPETAELLSQMAGDTTVSHKQVSYRGGRFDLVMDHRNITQQEIRRRLITPDEAMRLDPDHAVVFVAGQQPIYAAKGRYFADRELARRAGVRPPECPPFGAPATSPWQRLDATPAAPPAVGAENSMLGSGPAALDLERMHDQRGDRSRA